MSRFSEIVSEEEYSIAEIEEFKKQIKDDGGKVSTVNLCMGGMQTIMVEDGTLPRVFLYNSFHMRMITIDATTVFILRELLKSEKEHE